jgi:predicted DNA-binding protein
MNKENLDKIDFWLPEELKLEFKFLAMKKKRSMTQILKELVEQYVEKENQGGS